MTHTKLMNSVDTNEVNDNRMVDLTVMATPEELLSLAKELDILEVRGFQANVKIVSKSGDLYQIKGRIRASVVQACSVTLVPVDEAIDETFDELLTTNATTLVPEEDFEGNSDTPVDLIVGERINTGEILTQWLALSLNPYPRSDAPVFEYIEDAKSLDGKKTYSPFTVLAGLKDQNK